MRKAAWIVFFLLALLSVTIVEAEPTPSVTVMVYICGSDLEKWGGAASIDIGEMLAAELSEDVHVYVQTGGATRWKDNRISGGTVQRFFLNDGELHLMQDIGRVNMADENTLSDFITYCTSAAPADRYLLILWDHGGGPVYGYGSDELFGGSSMSLAQIKQALLDAGVHFDLIGFDACLMATIETGLMLSPCASYLVASENTEPRTGWAYTQWLSALSQAPDMDTLNIGKLIVDEYADACADDTAAQDMTLSVIDLNKLKDCAASVMNLFSFQAQEMLSDGDYAQLAQARGQAKAFGYAQHDLVDVIDIIERVDTPNTEQFTSSIREAIPYSRHGKMAGQTCGLSMYFPFNNVDALSSMQSIYTAMPDMVVFSALLSDFATIKVSGSTGMSGREGWWFNQDYSQQMNAYIVSTRLTSEEMTLVDKGDYYTLRLTDDAWSVMNNAQMQLSFFDENGQCIMGMDDDIAFDEDGDMIAAYNGTWVALNGQLVPFYSDVYIEDGDYFRYSGFVPVEIDGEDRELVLIWDNDHPDGLVIGARPVFEDAQTVAHGLLPIELGSVIAPYSVCFPYDSDDITAYYFGDEIVYDGELTVSYEDVASENVFCICFILTDIYGNTFYSEDIYIE